MPTPDAPARRTAILVLGLTLAAFALRVGGLTSQSLWRDEVDALRFALMPLSEFVEAFRQPGQNGPLFFLGLRPWLAAAGLSEFALRFPSASAGTLAVPVSYTLLRRLAGRRPALLTALLVTTAPYLTWYSQDAKMYALLSLMVPLGLLLVIEARRRGGWWRWGALYAATSAGFYIHLLAALAVPVQVLWLLILPERTRWTGRVGGRGRRWLSATGYLALLCAPYLPLARWQVPMWLSPGQGNGRTFIPLPDILATLRAAFIRGIRPIWEPLTLWPAMLALLAGIGLSASGVAGFGSFARAPRQRAVALLLIWLVVPILAVYLVSLSTPIFLDRYLIWIMPAFLALVGLGVVALDSLWRPLGLITLGAILALNVADVWSQNVQPAKSDLRSATSFVIARQQPDDVILFQIPQTRFAFSYYSDAGRNPSNRSSRWLDGEYTNGGTTEQELAERMAQATADARAVWMVASEVELWDQRDLTRAWLASHGNITDHADFTRVSVTRYQLHR